MRIGILTSSRADYGIYFPLLEKLSSDSFFEMEIIAFGTHLSKYHGYTVTQIESDFKQKIHKISALLSNDDPQSIASSYGLTVLKFADFWADHTDFDLIFCLGDRFEMSAAVQAGIPYGLKFAHIHGGETTLGAIDDVFRHQITLASRIHFTSTDPYLRKVQELTSQNEHVYTVGSLSLDGMQNFTPIDKKTFYARFEIPDKDFILITFHPETVALDSNIHFAQEMKVALSQLQQTNTLIITMPNADTLGTEYRKQLEQLKREFPDTVLLIENFGKANYFSAMYYARLLLGNTSSGIIEAASFNKYVINVGDRQKGRAQSNNTLNAAFDSGDILTKTKEALALGEYTDSNIYFKENTADEIIQIIKGHAKF